MTVTENYLGVIEVRVPGPQGAAGADGVDGTAGANGANGADGADGAGVFDPMTIIVNATTAYTLSSTGLSATIEMSNAGASLVTVPPTTADDIPVGSYFNLVRMGAGAVSVTTGSGVTLHSVSSARILNGQYAMATIYKTTNDTWIIGGALTT